MAAEKIEEKYSKPQALFSVCGCFAFVSSEQSSIQTEQITHPPVWLIRKRRKIKQKFLQPNSWILP